MAGGFSGGNNRAQTKYQRRKRPLIATISMYLLLCVLCGGVLSRSFFAPVTEAFAVTAAETAVVGEGIGSKNGEDYKYSGVNSMVGTLISWNGTNGGYNQHHIANMSSVWVVDNKGEMVNGANSNRCPPINFYSKKNDNLSAIKLIKGKNATPDYNTKVDKKPELYEGETFNNITKGTFNGVEGVNYFTVGGSDASPQQISSDWAKAIFAASLYSNSGILDNEDFGGAKDPNEYTFGWNPEYQAITARDGGNAVYVTKFGTPFNESLIEDNKAGEYNYIAIKLESDWTATDVSGISDVEKDETTEPVGVKTHIGRLSNGVNDNNPNGDTLIPLGTTFDANYDQHIIDDIDKGDVYLKSVYASGKVDAANSTESRPLSQRIKNYATAYNREIRTQQFTFCPAGEGYSFGRLAIPDNAYVILDLNGHKIDRALNDNDANVDTIVQSVFILGQYARLEVFDSSVSEKNPYGTGEVKGGVTRNGTGKVFDNQTWDNYGSDSNYANGVKGGGFTLRNRAELTVHSGSVTDNQGLFGGAFYGVGASTVNVFDARVEGNSALRGGMCYLSQGSYMTLNMFGGLVQGNSARMDGFAEKNSHDCARRPAVTDPEAKTAPNIYDEQYQKNPDGYGHEGGGVCVYQESYCNIYGGTIAYNYSATFGGGISVSYNSFLKLFGGEITGNVAKGMIRNINGAQIVSASNPKEHEIPKANVGGAGINMYQDSAGIYLNGPAKVMGNYCSQDDPDKSYSAEAIAALINSDTSKEDSNLYLSLTTSMARYSWNTNHYDDSKTRYKLTGDWDEEYGPTFKTGGTAAGENQAVSRKGQMKFNSTQHLYPEIKVQGPLYRDATHVAQVSITPAAGIEAGGYIMRQFYPKGWEDGTDGNKQTSSFNGTNGPRPLKSGDMDESSHAKNQLNPDGNTTFNLRDYLKTGATTGYVDGFLFTDGGTSIVAGTGNDDGWYLALGTRQDGNLPVQWQYYDRTVDTATDKPKGWTEAKTTAETGTGFSLVYNGEDRKYDIRVFVDRTKLTSDSTGGTSDYFYLYYDYYTKADKDGNETELVDGVPQKHYLFTDEGARTASNHTNILYITSGYDSDYSELTQTEVKYVSERYDRLGYRFTIRSDIKGLIGEEGQATPFNEKDSFIANPNYATMKIERATLTISRLSLANINRYYDGTTDFYVPTNEIQVGELTGYAASDQSNLKIQFTNEQNNYVKGTLQNPNVGSNTVSLGVMIEEIGFGEEGSHKNHNANTFPDKCLLANYMLYDLNTDTTYPAEDRKEMSVTLNVNVKPKPITVILDKQTYEYGSIPAFDDKWGTHAGTANWAETYEKANGGVDLEKLFAPSTPLNPGDDGFSPDLLGLDGKLAQVDIDNEGIDDEHGGTVDRANLALRLDQILKIMFTSNYSLRSQVGMYGGSFSYTNGNYDVTWKFGENEVRGMTDAGAIMPAQIDNLIEITKRKITANIPDAESIYGESQAALSLPDENIKHVGGVGDGLVFGDRLDAVLALTDPQYVATASNMLRATVDADGKNINANGYYNIAITNLKAINANYELTEENVTNGKYVVYPRKIVLTARDYDSVYGDPVDSNMGGYDYTLAESQENNLEVTSTAVFPTDLAAFEKGISYAYDVEGAHTNAGSYLFNVKFNHASATERGEDIGINYDVSFGPSATHTIAKRQVVVLIASPGEQSSEYGETPHVKQGTGTGKYWFPQHTTNGKSKDVVLPADMEKFITGIELYIAEAVNETAPVGQYPLMCRYDPSVNDNNYEVEFTGVWEGDVAEKYKDPAFGDLTKRAGVYTISRRSITLNISTTLASEYGDELEEFWGSGAYTFSREDGEDAVVNDDVLTFAPSLFYIQVSSSEKVIGGDENKAFAKNGLHAMAYTVIFDSAEYKKSDSYKSGANANYEITANIGRYTVERRKIKVEIGATVGEEFQKDAAIEYGNDVPERTARVTRLSGKSGEGFVGTDGERLFAALAQTTSISQYDAGLTGSKHLRASKYDFYVSPSLISTDYDVTFEFGTLTVNRRTVRVRILKQTTSYTGVEPNVDNSRWEFVEGDTLASGDEKSIVALDKTDGVNAGKYDITLSCTDNNYNFVIDGNSGENAFVITPAEVDFAIVGGEAIYDAIAHRANIIFLGKNTPEMFGLDTRDGTQNDDGSITFSEGGYVYTVTYRYSGEWGTTIKDSKDFVNAGHYTVTVTLISSGTFGVYSAYSGNYCFSFDGSSETAVYTKDVKYDISKATIRIADILSAPYNRDEQEAGWAFANDVNPGVVPKSDGYTFGSGRVRYAKKDIADNDNARLGGSGLPYYCGKYEFTLTLTDDDAKNFMFTGEANAETKDFTITALEILPALAQSTAEYDDKSRFHGDLDGRQGAWSFNFSSTTDTSVDGIGYNIEFKYNGLGATGSEKGEHTLTVKVGGDESATTYFVDGSPISKERLDAILNDSRAFIDAGTYTYTLTFEHKNFLLLGGSGATDSLAYTYTITPVLLSVGTFADKEFNNSEQDADVTQNTFTPTSAMTAEEAYRLLENGRNGYTLAYSPDTEANHNSHLGANNKPLNAGTYIVEITLTGKNFAFSRNADGTYLYTDNAQRFIITPFDIATLLSPGDLLAAHAFEGELDSNKTDLDEDGILVYTYTYTGLEIMPKLVRATIRLTLGGEPIVYESEEDLAAYFSLGDFQDNVLTDIVSGHHAQLVVTGKGNYTGTTTMAFSIIPMELTANIGNATSAYGETLKLNADLISYEDGNVPHSGDDLQYTFTLVGEERRGSNVIAGRYAIKAECGNLNYKITFKGGWKSNDDNNDVCGVYEVEKRHILVNIGNQAADYSGKKPTVNTDRGSGWNAVSSYNGTGDAIVGGDENLKITLDIKDETNAWGAKTYVITGALVEDDIGRNYTVTWETGIFTINAVKITVELENQTSVYNGEVPTPNQGNEWYKVTSGGAVNGENLDDFITIYIVNAGARAMEYQLSGSSANVNYSIDFKPGKYTITPREITVTIEDAESYYGEAEVELGEEYWSAALDDESVGGDAIIAGDDLHIQLRKDTGRSAGEYDINPTWNNDSNYSVTFKSASNLAKQAGTYTIKKRPIVVHINDQKGVYGSINTGTLSQNQGEGEAWCVAGFSAAEDEESGLLTGDYVYEGDRLEITLNRAPAVQPGKYAITGSCANANYAVTFEGDWEGDENNGKAGTYTIAKRQVVITVLTQYGTYGQEKTVSQNLGIAYTVECENATDGIAFVLLDGVSLKFAIGDDVNDVGRYSIYLTIEFGVTDHAEWYEITVKEKGISLGDGKYEVKEAYEVERRRLTVTISDLNSVYGDPVQTPGYDKILSDNVSGEPILESDRDIIKAEILAQLKLMVGGAQYGSGIIDAGTYDIEGTAFTSANGNYDITFTGNNGEKGVYTVVKRAITVSIQNKQSTYGEIGDYVNDEAEKAKVNESLEMTAATSNGHPANVAAVNDDDLGITLYISDPQLSTSRHLKQGKYYIYASYSTDEHITKNYTFNIVWGEYTVNAREITITLGTENPQSEYGDEITDQSTWGWTAALTFGDGTAVFEEDKIELVMTTTLKKGDDVGNGRITAELTAGDNDNGNYNITFTFGNYSIVQREIVVTVDDIASVTYGTEWAQPTYTSSRAGGKAGDAILNGEVSVMISVQNPQRSETGYLRYVEGGYYLSAAVTGSRRANYKVEIKNLDVVKYVVQKKNITITIEDATSVYGEDFEDLKWTDTYNGIVQNDGKKDDLDIMLRRENAGNNVGSYPIAGTCGNTDYNVTFVGSWNEDDGYKGNCGTYTVTSRVVWIDIIDQKHAVYGETFSVNGPQEGSTFNYSEGNTYKIVDGDSVATIIRLIVKTADGNEWDSRKRLDAGWYTLTAVGGNGNYEIVVKQKGHFVVNERHIRVTIDDQRGIYGEANNVDQTRYSPQVLNGTGMPIVDGDSIVFTLYSDASKEKANAGTYAINGDAKPQDGTKLGNYIIEYAGSFAGGKRGTYTISKRSIAVTITDQNAVYGGADGSTLVPKPNNTLYTASYDGDTANAILPGDSEDLAIRFSLVYDESKDLSGAGALKVGTYAIVATYGRGGEHNNYDVVFVGSWAGDENNKTAGTFTVTTRNVTVTIGLDGSLSSSSYGDDPKGPWTQTDTSMYTYALNGEEGLPIVHGDNIQFTMHTLAEKKSPVGTYPIIGELVEGANDNGNYSITFTGGFKSGGGYEQYVGRAGIYTVTPRGIVVEIGSYTREYGENVNNKEVLSALNDDETNGVYFTLPEGWSKNGDTVESLSIVLDCTANVRSPAQSYTITGSASGGNYEVTFTGGENKYIIEQRRIYVVILPQVSVYGGPINVDQNAWYAYRNGNKATWNGGSTVDNGGVLAAGDNLDSLLVRLTKRVAIDGYDYNEGNGTYGGQYAIEGDYSNSNYNVIFVGANAAATRFFQNGLADFKTPTNAGYDYSAFTSVDNYRYDEDPDRLLEKEFGKSGIYTVAPKKVVITLNDVSGTYGGNENALDHNMKLKKGVQLDSTYGIVWSYDFGSGEIDAGHIGYLTFYLGGKFAGASAECLTPGKYPVIAYWGLDLGSNSRVRDWNYEITFHGSWSGSSDDSWTDTEGNVPKAGMAGSFTIGNATIEQYGDWYESLEYILEHGTEPYVMSVNGSMTDYDPGSRTGKRYLTFKGDITEGEISYGDLYFNANRNSTDGAQYFGTSYKDTDHETGAPRVNEVGYWILKVTVSAAYHNDATFDLVYRITPDLIVITLQGDASFEFTYGDYQYDDRALGGQSFAALESALKDWLLGEDGLSVVSGMRMNGKEVSETELGNELNELFINNDVVVSVYKMTGNRSTGGYLNAGRYLLTISGGVNLEITFAREYEAVTCTPKTVTATWTMDGEIAREKYPDDEGADLFTVTYDGRQHPLATSVLGKLDGDRTTGYDVASYRFDGGVSGASATPLGYGDYVCRVTSRALGGADGSNYTVEENLRAYVSVEKRAVTVQIKDRSTPHIYGDNETEFGSSDWELKDSTMAPGEDRNVLGVVLTRDPGKDVGSYKVTGTYSNENYDVTFNGSWKKDGDPDNGKCGTFVIDPRPITVHLIDKKVTYGTEFPKDPEDVDLASDITLWYATYDNNIHGIAIIQGDDIKLTMKIQCTAADFTDTGYLKVKRYAVKGSWDNDNYEVTFQGTSSAESRYIVEKCRLRVSLFDKYIEYGDDRPEISTVFTGFATGDEDYFNEHPFIRFFFYDPAKGELAPDAEYDPVGTYAVCGEVTNKNDPIGANYDVYFVGSWSDNTYPDLVQQAGVYQVTPRTISIIIGSVTSEYGVIAYVPIKLQEGSRPLVGSDKLEDLNIVYKTNAYYDGKTSKPGVYPIKFESIGNPNYRISGAMAMGATYTVTKRNIKITAGNQRGEYGDVHKIERVKDEDWHVYWVTESGDIIDGYDGIAYDSDALNNLELFCNISQYSPVGKYDLYASFDLEGCYNIISEEYGQYEIVPRKITVWVNDYELEYGEDHVAHFRTNINQRGGGYYFTRDIGEPIARQSDPINNSYLTLDVTKTSDVGDYPIIFSYKDPNYNVTIKGSWPVDGDKAIGGTYKITPRKITVTINDQEGEYGDEHTLNQRYGVDWTASRAAGGPAIIGTDNLMLVFSTNADEKSVVSGGPYYITATCGNDNYHITVNRGTYKVTPRKLVAKAKGESEYGDPIQKVKLELTRATEGLSGPGIMSWDEAYLTIDPYFDVDSNSPVGSYPVTYRINGDLGENYEIVSEADGEYVIKPREIVVDIASIEKVYGDPIVDASDLAFAVSRAGGKDGAAIIDEEIAIRLQVLYFSRNAGEYVIDIIDPENGNYHITVNQGTYKIKQKAITVHIDDRSSEYGSATAALTSGEIEGLVEGDDLGLSLRVEWGDDLDWHNVGEYAIVGTYDNANYSVTFDGTWLVDDKAIGGTYTVSKADNAWLSDYSGDGTIVQGTGFDAGEAPAAKFGQTVLRYYYDEDCTQEIECDISELEVGTYYVKATVADTLNYSGVESKFVIEVLSSFIYPSKSLDISLFVCIFASQFVIGIFALLFVKRRKNNKNKSQSEGTTK